MLKRYSIIMFAGLIVLVGLAYPASAQGEEWSIGGGYWTLPSLDSGDGAIETSGMFASVRVRSPYYMMEIDYAIDDPGFLVLATDYLYALGEQGRYVGGSGYLGIGYTYFSCDDLDQESGFNVLLAAEFGQSLFGAIRYDFLGSDQELFTINITYGFR